MREMKTWVATLPDGRIIRYKARAVCAFVIWYKSVPHHWNWLGKKGSSTHVGQTWHRWRINRTNAEQEVKSARVRTHYGVNGQPVSQCRTEVGDNSHLIDVRVYESVQLIEAHEEQAGGPK